MKYDFILTSEQQVLVEQHMDLVGWVISRHIRTNEGVYGLGRDDLSQEGALALCRAAATYNGTSAQFSTYAAAVIRNHLLDCCKAANTQQKHLCSLPVGSGFADDEHPPSIPEPSVEDKTDSLIDQIDMTALLAHYKREYSGVAQLGIEALELKIRGYSGADIARLYHTEPNHVGAWLSRAKAKLKKAGAFRHLCSGAVEKSRADS